MKVFFPMSIFSLDPDFELSFDYNSAHKNQFISTCCSWDARLCFSEMYQKNIFDGTVGYGDSYLEFLFDLFKKFRLFVIPQDVAGAVQSQSGKGPGYSYNIGRGSNWLLGHVTGLLVCLYVKLSAFRFPFVDFWNIMSWITLFIELAYKKGIRAVGSSGNESVQVHSFRSPEEVQTHKGSILVQERIAWVYVACKAVVVWITVNFHTLFLKT